MGSLKPFLPLMYLLGNFYMQVFDGQLEEILLIACHLLKFSS